MRKFDEKTFDERRLPENFFRNAFIRNFIPFSNAHQFCYWIYPITDALFNCVVSNY